MGAYVPGPHSIIFKLTPSGSELKAKALMGDEAGGASISIIRQNIEYLKPHTRLYNAKTFLSLCSFSAAQTLS
jgi:hypothetical protein